MIIAIDTREQRPLEFDGMETQVTTLKAGDYSIVGYESEVACERKSYNDLWGSMSNGRHRFERCVQRLSQLNRAAIVVECSMAEACVQPAQIQRTNTASVIGGLISWSCRYNIPVFFCEDRAYAARVVFRFLASYLKHRESIVGAAQ